jgi:serine/threonine protein kinase
LKFVRQQKLGDFEIMAHLDTGGMAEVYLARQTGTQFLAVVKMLNEHLRHERELLDMFEEESRVMTQLHHANVVSIIGIGEYDGLPYMVLEYLAGDHLGVLSKLVRKQNQLLPASTIARIFLQVANGLSYVHEATNHEDKPLGLIHRDVSPQNIFVCYDGRIKVLDFGIALTVDREVFTRTGLLKGKIRYMSPEQVNSEQLDQRSDIFSVGVVMWELATGHKLFQSSSEFRSMKMICDEPAQSPQSLRPDLPDELTAIIMTCLKRDPENRFQNAGALRQALSDFVFAEQTNSHGEELPRIIEQLLGNRMRAKEAFLETIHDRIHLQEFLFGDLGDDLEESDSGVVHKKAPPSDTYQPIAPKVTPPPVQSRPDPIQPVIPEPQLDIDALDSSTGPAPKSRSPLLLILVAVLLAVGSVFLLWPAEKVDQPTKKIAVGDKPKPIKKPRVVDGGQAQDAQAAAVTIAVPDAGPQEAAAEPIAETVDGGVAVTISEPVDGGVDAQSGSDPIAEMGWLRFDTTPPTEVYVKNHLAGKTPIWDMVLEPGVYELKLINKEADISKTFKVRIIKGEICSHKLIF